MADEYQILVKAVRRPMSRWWRSVGVWWVILLVVMLIAAPLPFLRNPGQPLLSVSPYIGSVLAIFAGITAGMIPLLLLGIWLKAASVADGAANALLNGMAAPRQGAWAEARFRLCFAQGHVLLGLVLLGYIYYGIVLHFHSTVTGVHGLPGIAGLIWHSTAAISQLLPHVLFIILLIGLTLLMAGRPGLSWLWLVAHGVPIVIHAILGVISGLRLAGPSIHTVISYTFIPYAWAIGLVIVIGMFWAFSQKRLFVGYACCGFMLIAYLADFMFTHIPFPVNAADACSTGSLITSLLAQVPDFLKFMPAYFTSEYDQILRQMTSEFYIGSALLPSWRVPVGLWGFVPALLINIAWVVGWYFFIKRVIIRLSRTAWDSESSVPK